MEQPKSIGLPSAGFIASKLNLSANYFGDLVKRETGKSALAYIHLKLIHIALFTVSPTRFPFPMFPMHGILTKGFYPGWSVNILPVGEFLYTGHAGLTQLFPVLLAVIIKVTKK